MSKKALYSKKILGISAYYHDSSACLVVDGEIISAVQEERFTRKKHDSSFPTNCIQYCLKENHLKLNDIDSVIYYEKPLLTFERLLETYLAVAPLGLRSFIAAMQVWLKQKLFLKYEIEKELKKINLKNSHFKSNKNIIPKLLYA